jgi:hypothetical protein
MSRLKEFNKYLPLGVDSPDDISAIIMESWDDLFSMESDQVEAWRLNSARSRFNGLRDGVKILGMCADERGIKQIDCYEDIIPLLFQHTQYKSYPLVLVEKGNFRLLTKWLDGLTTVDLSQVDVSGCNSIDSWLEQLEIQADLYVTHTAGTTGKLSFFPRSVLEQALYTFGALKLFEAFGEEAGENIGFDGVRLPAMYPSSRHGRYAANRLLDGYSKYVTPTPDQVYTMTQGTLSADLVSLSGRVRVAQQKGELDRMELDDSQKITLKRYLQEQDRRPQEVDQFMGQMMTELKGQKVFITTQMSYMSQAAEEGLKRGIKNVFHPDSVGLIGGGTKGAVITDNWEQQVREFTGMRDWRQAYAMSEMVGLNVMCPNKNYHIPPFHIPFLLDPETGKELPRSGVQTGRYAFLDLLPSTYWGGLVTGDQVTIDWGGNCGCGRKGAFIHDSVSRYSEQVTGDDKVLCSATVDNTDSALQALLAI